MEVGVIGTGMMGRNHVRTYADLRGVDQLYVTDADGAAGRDVAQKFGAEFVQDTGALLNKVDAVSICVPTKLHFEIAKKAMDSGVDCLIEKPIALTPQEGRELEKLRQKAGVVAGVGHIERFNPIIRELKKMLTAPYYIEINRHNPTSGRITDADVITDLMVHDIDLVWNFLMKGEKGEVLSASGLKNAASGQADFAVSTHRLGRCVAVLSANRLSSRKIRHISVEDQERTIVGNLMSQELFIYHKPSEVKSERLEYKQESRMEQVTVGKIEPLREELRTFLECSRQRTPFPVGLDEASSVLEVADKVRRLMG